MTTTAHRRSFTVAALGVAALLTLVACAGADGDDAGGSTADSAAQPQGASAERQLSGSGDDAGGAEAPAEDGADADVSSAGSEGSVAVPVLDAERSVISTAVVSVRSDDATRTRTEVMRIVDVHRGQVSDEETSTDESGQVQLSRLVLRIPASDFAETVGELEKVGELASSDKSSEDVSFDVIDTRARIRAQEQSLRRVELLLERAESIRDVVSIESELTRRQAELEALKSKQAYLSDQTTYATITVYVEQKGEREKPTKPDTDESGFLAGLDSGWTALAAFATVLATIVGALLPWLVVLAILGWPTWLLARRFARRRPDAPAAPTAGAQG